MWGNPSFSGKKSSPKSRLNSTLPAFVTSPISTRQRQPDRLNQSMNTSILSAAGPPLSSPFMPQIKRALGLEPDQKRLYGGLQRRHSFNTAGYQSSTCLPHVVLNKSRQPPLKERNTSMLKRSSTVKIAPPTHGKIGSPSLYQMRNKSIGQEDRSTPDTYAVISALIERRKRPITSNEDSHEVPIQHAKRRRQESQQSNASTSSMPSMPDNLPDLSNTDFSIRIETPDINRPSRPSQEETHAVWDGNTSINRPRQENRNNPILSSLSSSKRFAQSQRMKRRAENIENETGDLIMKSQRKAPPKLSHFNSPLDTSLSITQNSTMLDADTSLPLTNGHNDTTSPSENSTLNIPQKEKPLDKPAPLKQLPSLKKRSSVCSPLSQQSSIRKAQYANVVATLDDYDSDREAENRRVQQMLNDVDKPFSTSKPEKPEIKATSVNTATTVTMSQTVQPSSSVTAASSTSVSSLTGSITSVAGSTNEQPVPKSPIQEVGDSPIQTLSTATSVTKSNKTLSSLLTTESKLIPAATSRDVTSLQASGIPSLTSTASLKGNFNFGAPQTSAVPATSGTLPLLQTTAAQSSTSGTLGLPNGSVLMSLAPQEGIKNSQGLAGTTTQNKRLEDMMPGGFKFVAPSSNTFTSPSNEVVGFGLGSTSTGTVTQSGATVQSPGQTSLGGFGVSSSTVTNTLSSGISQAAGMGGFTFGTLSSTPSTSTPVFGISTNPVSTALPGTSVASGFTFGLTSAAPAITSSGFSFGTSAVSASSPAGGFTLGSSISTSSASTGGFTLGSSISTSSASTGGFTFGTSTIPTSTAATGGFTFKPVSTTSGPSLSTGGNSLAPVSSNAGGFSFGTTVVSSTSTPNTGGFSFGLQPSSMTSPLSGNLASITKSEPTAFSGFGQKPTTQASTGGFTFGSSLSNTGSGSGPFGSSTTNSNPAFSFGGNVVTTTAMSSTPFTFNSGATSTTASTTPFTFGAGVNKTTAATPFSFSAGTGLNAPSTTANTGFGFGLASTSATSFQFGGTNASKTSGFAFGSANQTAAFGASTNQVPAFGTANKPPAFGSSNTTPAFGSTNQASVFGTTNQAPAFGATNQAPAFGATNQPPAFGSTNTSSVFGNTSSQPSVFGTPAFGAATQNQPATNSVFGAPATTQQATSSVFGTTANNSNQSVFGTGAGTAPGFGKSHSMPTFGSNNSSNAGTFSFGGQPAPNVNPFGQGQTTPAKQTGNAFGSLNTDSTPKNQTGSMFAFGQNNNDSVKKGFDFSAAAGAGTPSAGGFNFAAAASSTPVFNFGATASTPAAGFGTPTGQPSFSIGTGDGPKPPRPMARGRRRMQRR